MNAISEQMRAVQIVEPGGPEVLQLTSCPVPVPSAEQVLIKVHAAGVNRPDCLQRAGLYPLPAGASPLPGLEVAGEVVSLGSAVSRWQLGARVVALTHGGGYAEYCVAHAEHCLPWPSELSASEASGLPETCFTVHHNMLERGQLRAGETILIHGGSSGIGSAAIQIASALGATVISTAGSDEKCAYCVELGATHALNYRDVDFEKSVREIVGSGGVDVVLDMVAGPYVMKNIRLLGNDGRYVMIAFLQGATAEVNFAHVLPKRLTVTGSTLRPQSDARKRVIAAGVAADIWPLLANGKLRTHVHAAYPLAQAAEAHRVMEASTHMGKLILQLSE
jgi:NADPH2:quinone reductase